MKLIPTTTTLIFKYLLAIVIIAIFFLMLAQVIITLEKNTLPIVQVGKRAERVADSFIIAVHKWNNEFLTENDYSALWKEIYDFACQYIKGNMSNAEFKVLIAAIEEYYEPDYTPTYGGAMQKLVSEQKYFAFPDRVETFKLFLWRALTRKHQTYIDVRRRNAQHKWLREYVKTIPVRRDDFLARNVNSEQMYKWADDFLSKEFANPLSLLYEAMTDEQFELFKALMERSSSNGLRIAVSDIRSRAIGALAHKHSDIQGAYQYPFDIELPFDDEVISTWGGSNAHLAFASNAQFRGKETGLINGGVLDVIKLSATSIKTKAANDQLEELITQYVQEHNTGDLAYLDDKATVLCMRGAKLAELRVADWFEADRLSNDELRELINNEGRTEITEISVEGLPPMNGPGPRLDSRIFIAVETAKKRIAVIEFKNREFHSVRFRCRARAM